MKKLLVLPLILLVVACTPTGPDPVEVAVQEAAATIEEVRLPYYPYFKYWEKCEINGEVYEQVAFMYTDLGLGYIVDDILYYRLNMEVTWCEGALLEVE